MVNDEIFRKANCVIKMKIIEEKPRLCLFALKDLKIGDELRYDYGVPSKSLHWRKNIS